MEVAVAQRLTVDGDPQMFAGTIAYYDKRQPSKCPLWWSLQTVYAWSRNRGDEYLWRDWIKKFRLLLEPEAADTFYLRTESTSPTAIVPICTTCGMLTFLWLMVSHTRSSLSDHCGKCVVTAARRVLLSLPANLMVIAGVGLTSLRIRPSGELVGFLDALASCPNRLFLMSIQNNWQSMRSAGILSGGIFDDTHLLEDVLVFLMSLKRWRQRRKQRALAPGFWQWVMGLRRAFIVWLAAAIEHYTHHEYSQHHDVHKPPPSYSFSKPGRKRKYVRIHPEAAWDMMQKSVETHFSMCHVLTIRSGDADAGGCKGVGNYWVNMGKEIYHHRLSLAWPNANHICITADSSTHSYNDVLLGLAYSHELQQAAYPRLQFIRPGKQLHESQEVLTDRVSLLALEGNLERVAAYRQLQALSSMTQDLHHRSLDEYDIPGAHLEPVGKLSERRVVVTQDGLHNAWLVDKDTKTMRPVLPANLQQAPLLVLLLDQGSIGSAGSGFVDHEQKMIVMKWEKIHRLINDIKGSLKACCGGAPLKAQVYTSYLWSLKTKPFGSGFFGTLLEQALNIFSLRNTWQSPLFQKYLPRIAAEWGDPPLTTESEQQNIFQRVCDLTSLRLRGNQSKLGRWFSWNQSAYSFLDDFSAWKMVLEDCVAAVKDPDDDDIGFSDLKKAAKATTPLESLNKLRQQGGDDDDIYICIYIYVYICMYVYIYVYVCMSIYL